jgi:hypothetical protein
MGFRTPLMASVGQGSSRAVTPGRRRRRRRRRKELRVGK